MSIEAFQYLFFYNFVVCNFVEGGRLTICINVTHAN